MDALKGSIIYTPVFIAITTGLRRAEIAGLRWKDIDLSKKTIYVSHTLQRIEGKLELRPTKNETSNRTVTMFDALADHLKEVRKEQLKNCFPTENENTNLYYVCSWEDRKPMDPHYISTMFTKLIKEYNLPPIRLHDLRHSHATLLLKEGVHPKIVSERLGHSEIGTTMNIYSHVTPNMQKEAVEKLESSLFVKK